MLLRSHKSDSYRSVQTIQLCSMGQGTVSPWSIVPRCPRVLQVLPTTSDSWDCETWELSNIVGSTCNTPGQRGTMLHRDTVPFLKEKSCIVWTDLKLSVVGRIYHNAHCISFDALQMKLTKNWNKIPESFVTSVERTPSVCSKLSMLAEVASNKMWIFLFLYYYFKPFY